MAADGGFAWLVAGGGVFAGLLVALFLFRQGSAHARILGAAMIAAAANILHGLLTGHPASRAEPTMMEPLQFLLPPLFAGYVTALLDPAWRPRPRAFFHFLPFLLVSAAAFLLSTGATWPLPWVGPRELSLAFWLLLLAQALIYLRAALRRLEAFRRSLREEYSNLAHHDPKWLWWYSFALHLLYVAYAVAPVFYLHSGDPGSTRHLTGGALCAMVGIRAFRQLLAGNAAAGGGTRVGAGVGATEGEAAAIAARGADGLQARATATRSVAAAATSAVATATDARPPSFDPSLPAALVEAMEGRRLFLDPELSLPQLAAALGWPRNEVSAAINGRFGVNFHDFVNGYRVEEAKRLLARPEKKALTLVALAMEAGFNAKSTFNAVFRKATGLTPTEWARASRP